ncbi:MAG: NAD(P)H-hydrate dehydratase [Gemmatimonadales bacterium]
MLLPVISPQQSAEWDRRAEQAGIPVRALMESAGRGAAAVLAARFPERLRLGVLVACGPGNNGGDGWVVARALHTAGVPVWAAALPPRGDLPRAVAKLGRESGVREIAPDGPWPNPGLLVDAVLGTGVRGAPRGDALALIQRLADAALPIVAIDGPSGLDLGDGVQHGPLRATLTVTFGGYRRGHLLARDEVGDVVVIDIGLPAPDPAWPTLLTESVLAETIQPFAADTHKGKRGRVSIVGGDEGMVGAARMAARAAFGVGAGLVHLVAPAASVATAASAEPDLQTLAQSLEARPSARAAALLGRCDGVVIGPGLGRAPARADFILEVIAVLQPSARILLDADGLMAFAGQIERLRDGLRNRQAVLTPHAGEFRALFPDLAPHMDVDPWGAAQSAARRVGAVVLLKGVPTVVAGGDRLLTVAAGNPGLATGGSGDTLSGLTATFAAQGIDLALAAAAAACVLGEAADLAARRMSARSMRPMDVLQALPAVWRRLDLVRRMPPPPRPPIVHELPAPLRV